MAKFRVSSIEERVDGDVSCDTFVLVEKDDGQGGTEDVVIGHFSVILKAADILAVAGLSKPERVARYVELFSADPRIEQLSDSESAVFQMEEDVSFPVTVTL